MSDAKTLGNFIKSRREELGLSGRALAIEVGVSQQALNLWERNKRVPAGKYIKLLARVLKVEQVALLNLYGDDVQIMLENPQDDFCVTVEDLRFILETSEKLSQPMSLSMVLNLLRLRHPVPPS